MAKDPFELDKDRNPCTYKKVCLNCKLTRPEHRPKRCVEIQCEDLTQCKQCSRNINLNAAGYCQYCDPSSKKIAVRNASGGVEVIPHEPPNHPALQGSTAYKTVDAETGKASSNEVPISFPGTPPPSYSEDEKAYYNINWKSYSGHYRDPSVYSVVHNIILLEVELNWLSQWMLANRHEADKDMENKMNRLIENIKALRSMLPKKDAMEQTEDEMTIAMIHQRYAEETKDRRVGGIARFVSQDAIALAPYLEFPIDIVDIGVRLGYRMVDMVDALNKFYESKEVPSDPQKLLEFLGFYLRQNYALQDGDTIPKDDYEPIVQDDLIDEEEIAENKVLEDQPEEPAPTPPKPRVPRMTPPPDDDDNAFAISID